MSDVVIDAGARPQEPVVLSWKFPDCGEHHHVKITIGKNAHVTIIEELTSREQRIVNSEQRWEHNVEVIIHEGAHVEFVSQQMMDPSVSITIKQKSLVGANASIAWKNVTLGAKTVDHDLRSEVAGAGAESSVDWMFYAKSDEKYVLSARNIFLGRHGGGEMTMRGVAEDKGHVQCNGMIDIGPQGNQTDTYLTQEVLMLDTTAKVDAIPGLEIKTNDVKASHSATVSRVTDDDLFYFGSRGIQKREARRMFVEGFLADILEGISEASVHEKLAIEVQKKYDLAPA